MKRNLKSLSCGSSSSAITIYSPQQKKNLITTLTTSLCYFQSSPSLNVNQARQSDGWREGKDVVVVVVLSMVTCRQHAPPPISQINYRILESGQRKWRLPAGSCLRREVPPDHILQGTEMNKVSSILPSFSKTQSQKYFRLKVVPNQKSRISYRNSVNMAQN